MVQPIKILAMLLPRKGMEEALDALLRELTAASREEPGNLRYELWRDVESPHGFLMDEVYVDEQALAAHRASPHFLHYLKHVNALATRFVTTMRPLSLSGMDGATAAHPAGEVAAETEMEAEEEAIAEAGQEAG